MKSKYLFCILTILLVTGTAMALPLMIGELGRKVTISDEISKLKKGSSSISEIAGKRDKMECQSVAHRIWDFDHLYSNSSILSLVDGFECAEHGYGGGTDYPADDRLMSDFVLGPALEGEGDFGPNNPRLICESDRYYGILSEPATIILIGAGLIGIADFSRKKLQK